MDSYNHSRVIDNSGLSPALALFFSFHSIPLHIIESEWFWALVEAIRNSTVDPPSRYQLKLAQAALAQRTRADLVRRLRNHCRSAPLTVGIDGWTNCRRDKVTNVVILSGGVAYYWCSIVNGNAANTAMWMREPLSKVISGLRELGLIVAALVTDNERVNRTLHELLLPSFPFLVRSPCAAHILQLCVKASLALEEIEPVMITMEQLIHEYRLKAPRIKLKNLQIEANNGKHYKLVKPCDTRWSSHLYAAQRLLKLRAFIDVSFPQPASFWTGLAEVVRWLQPFQVATDVMQSDTSTLYDLYQQFNMLVRHIHDTPASSFFHSVGSRVLEIIQTMWERHVNIDAVVICAQLSFDQSVITAFKDRLTAARTWFLEFAAQYAAHYTLTSYTTVEQLRIQALDEWTQFLSRSPGTPFEPMADEVAMLRNKQMADNQQQSVRLDSHNQPTTHHYTRWNPKAVWHLYVHTAPVISHAAIAILSVAGSEAAVERTFSAQDAVHTKARNRMLDTTVEQEMFIKFNTRAMRVRPEEAHRGSYIELDEDMEAVEPVPRLAGLWRQAREGAEVEEKEEMAVEAAQERKEEGEEDEQKLPEDTAVISQIEPPSPPKDDLQRFIEDYVSQQRIHPQYKWREHHLSHLSDAAVNFTPPILKLVSELKRKVMAYVRAEAEKLEVGADAEMPNADV